MDNWKNIKYSKRLVHDQKTKKNNIKNNNKNKGKEKGHT